MKHAKFGRHGQRGAFLELLVAARQQTRACFQSRQSQFPGTLGHALRTVQASHVGHGRESGAGLLRRWQGWLELTKFSPAGGCWRNPIVSIPARVSQHSSQSQHAKCHGSPAILLSSAPPAPLRNARRRRSQTLVPASVPHPPPAPEAKGLADAHGKRALQVHPNGFEPLAEAPKPGQRRGPRLISLALR